MNDYRAELKKTTSDTTKAQNVNLFGVDFQLRREGNVCRISIQATAAVELALVPNSGSAVHLNGGAALTANGLHTFELYLDQSRTWNIQTPNAAGITVEFCTVVEAQA
tara:strand:- start:29033 stop:29356 length:324 start_codon:yes stop_codon:yes gene_type:complete